MSQPLFFVSNPDRRIKYVLQTRITDHGKSLVAEKRAATPSSQEHLFSMLDHFKNLARQDSLTKLVNIVPPKKKGDYALEFEYISGSNAERQLVESILSHDYGNAIKIISKLMSIIESLPTTFGNPTDNAQYKKIFGNSYDNTYECVEIGLLDINLDNFIIDKNNKWHLIDYEWVFYFPIPKRLLAQRFLWLFILRYQEIFRYHSTKIKSVFISEKICIPQFLYDEYKIFLDEVEQVQIADNAFREYVEDKPSREIVALHSEPIQSENLEMGTNRIIGQLEKYKLAIDKKNQQIAHLNDEKRALKNEMDLIHSSKAYRLTRKISRIKNKALKK